MRWFEHIFTYLFPTALLEGTPWHKMWRDRERGDFLFAAKLFFPIASVTYIAHYLFFDLPMQLEPQENWLFFRGGMAVACLSTFAIYASSMREFKYYRLPAAITGALICFSQAKVTQAYPDAPWIYCYAFVILCSVILRASQIKSVLFALFLTAIQAPVLAASGLETPAIASATIISALFVAMLRSGYRDDIKYFLLTQQNIDTQRKNIELNIEFSDRIKSFIPGQIAARLESYVLNDRMTVLQAIEEVLRPRKKVITCLYSDIRDFTEKSKDLETFVGNQILPNLKQCTTILEKYGGISRKIGDLVFSYFDSDRELDNLVNAILAGLDIATLNSDSSDSDIERYILISTGSAIVGNIGGFDSSIEITALGTPVNYLSRVDELSKVPRVRELLNTSDIVICERSLNILEESGVKLTIRKIDLSDLDLVIRNFTDRRFLYIVERTTNNHEALRRALTATGEAPHNESTSGQAA